MRNSQIIKEAATMTKGEGKRTRNKSPKEEPEVSQQPSSASWGADKTEDEQKRRKWRNSQKQLINNGEKPENESAPKCET
jgi:hypothetical protein